jgi:ABC-type multidrug transport system ATPase subunit
VNPPKCSIIKRYGDVVLESRGNQTDERWIWYGIAVLAGLFMFFVLLSTLVLHYWRVEPKPLPPLRFEEADYKDLEDDPLKEKNESAKRSRNVSAKEDDVSGKGTKEAAAAEQHKASEQSAKRELESLIHNMAFEPVTMAFRDIWYTVHVKGKTKKENHDVDLLRGISGYFEPGTMTALMGNTGAGKTTLMDVLAGRKNQGKVKGDMFVNGRAKNEHSFQRLMGYVEQFDSLAPKDTVREAVEFSAALRLPNTTSAEQREKWVNYVLKTLELNSLANTMIGLPLKGGISFEQRKRTSMAVELAANPSLLFLDEPTTGLDSRAALVVVRCIRRIAATGRTVVCTIHQPSTSIFSAFDSLLLLRRGGQAAYMGPVGVDFDLLIEYFTNAPGVR